MHLNLDDIILSDKEKKTLRKIASHPNRLFRYNEIEALLRYKLIEPNKIFQVDRPYSGHAQFFLTTAGDAKLRKIARKPKERIVRFFCWILGVVFTVILELVLSVILEVKVLL